MTAFADSGWFIIHPRHWDRVRLVGLCLSLVLAAPLAGATVDGLLCPVLPLRTPALDCPALRNGGFEACTGCTGAVGDAPDAWTAGYADRVQWTTDDAQSGVASVRLVGPGYAHLASDRFRADPEIIYRVEAWYRTEAFHPDQSFRLAAYFLDRLGDPLYVLEGGVGVLAEESWSKTGYEVTAPASTATAFVVVECLDERTSLEEGTCSILVDDVSVAAVTT